MKFKKDIIVPEPKKEIIIEEPKVINPIFIHDPDEEIKEEE